MQQLIDMMLEKQPENRPTAEALVARVGELMPNEDKSRIMLNCTKECSLPGQRII